MSINNIKSIETSDGEKYMLYYHSGDDADIKREKFMELIDDLYSINVHLCHSIYYNEKIDMYYVAYYESKKHLKEIYINKKEVTKIKTYEI